MTAVQEWAEALQMLPTETLTAEQYEALPEDVCRRIEVVDGAVVVTPAPRREHQDIASNLRAILNRAGKPRFRASMDVDLRLSDVPLLNRRPDIAVYDSNIARASALRSTHCVLVVEIVSPGSVETDKVTKPYEYATAGIEHYWRVENPDDTGENLSIFRYRLNPGAREYTLIGTDTGKMSITDPFPVTIDDFNDLFW